MKVEAANERLKRERDLVWTGAWLVERYRRSGDTFPRTLADALPGEPEAATFSSEDEIFGALDSFFDRRERQQAREAARTASAAP